MRILAIRGQNLASLAQPFEVDLSAEPLAGTGLFAITGDTGAGKSTILDAMCLALYGEYPRASGGRREKTLDASGEAIEATDPVNILRRGAGRGFAEVDFVGIDGAHYRARWEVRRARGKATGKLQDADRKLESIADGSGVASGKRDVSAAVEKRTGLTFEQFRRTVLLAQGEFDAFLMAGEADRAELLEKITGTTIYSAISIRVFDATAERRRAVEELERRHGDVALMSEEERAALVAEAEGARAREAALTADLGRIAAAEQAGRDLARLSGEARLAAKGAETAVADEASAAGAVEALAAPLREAEAAWREAWDAVNSWEPAWADASRLDTQIEAAAAEVGRAETAHTEAEHATTAASGEAERLEDELRALDGKIAACAAELDQLSAHASLASDAVAIARLFADARTAVVEQADAAAAIAALDGQRKTALGQSEEAKRVRAARLDDRKRQGDALDQIRTALARMDPPRVMARSEALNGLVATLREAWDAAKRRDEHTAAAQEARAAAADAADVATTMERARDEARASIATAQAARGSLQPLADLADAAADQAAAHLRSVLADGAPCPVCGALEHPFAADGGAAAALVASVRERRAELDREIAALEKTMADAGVSAAAARGREQSERAAARKAERDAEAAAARLVERVGALSGNAAQASFELGPLTAATTVEAIAALGTRAAVEQSAASAERQGIDELRRKVEDLQRQVDAATEAADAARTQLDEVAATLAGIDVERARQDQALAAARRAREAVRAGLAPYLSAAGIDADGALRDAAAVAAAADRVKTLGAAYAARATEHAALMKSASDGRARHERAAFKAAGLQQALRQGADALAERRRRLAELKEARAALLGGEATDVHRARFIEAEARARAAFDGAKAALAKAEADLGSRRALREAADSTLTVAKVRMGEAASGALAALTAAGAEFARPAGGSGDDVDGAMAAALAGLGTRRAGLEVEARAARERLTEIRVRLEDDETAMKRRATIAGEIARAREDLRVWEDVNEAIGQRDGSKFRRFAQSVTLDQLVRIANAELDTLNPRYALRRGAAGDLTLDVVDRDMGDEVRTPRSLSGGERFLVALALALALSGLEGRHSFVDTLFIDEGFGSLDRDTLDVAIDALEALQGHGRKVGVITHVPAMIERIAVQVRVVKRGGGLSDVRISTSG